MALATYSDLQTSVAAWLHRQDLASVIPDFITLAEQRMNSDIAARDMDTTTTLTTTAGVNYVALPTDVTESKLLQITSTDPKRTLNFMPLERLSAKYPYTYQSVPQDYTVSGSNIILAPIPDTAYTIAYTYRQRIPALSGSNTTNWLLTKWPNTYLYASLVAAAPYLGQDARIAVWEDQYQKAVQDVNNVDWFSGTGMFVRAV